MRVFQWWPFTLTQVLYEYELPVTFTRTNSFWAGRVFIKPVRCKQRKIRFNLFTHAMMCILRHKLSHCWVVIWWRCAISKIINTRGGILLLFRKAFSRFELTGDCQWTRVELSLYKWPWMLTCTGEACTSHKLKPGLRAHTRTHINVNVA